MRFEENKYMQHITQLSLFIYLSFTGTQLSLLTEKEEKVISKRPTLSVSEEPSWMELAKKKSQAWSDMPQIIK